MKTPLFADNKIHRRKVPKRPVLFYAVSLIFGLSSVMLKVGLTFCYIFPATGAPSLSHTAPPPEWVQLKKSLKKRKSPLTSPLLQRRMERIHRVLKTNKQKALDLIQNMEKVLKNRPAERARLHLLRAQIHLSMEDMKKAMLYYQKAHDSQKLTYGEQMSLLYDMAFLHLMNKNTRKADQISQKLFYLSDKLSDPPLHILKAYILTEQNKKKQALKRVMTALTESTKPKEHWLALGAGLNLEAKKYHIAIKLLSQLTSLKPQKKQYWKQLSSAYLNIDKEDKALATLDLSYKLDFLEKESEILHLTSLLLAKNLPLKAGLLMEKALKEKKVKSNPKNHEILGDLWQRAENIPKALKHYQKSSAFAKKGKIFAKMGRLYTRTRNWKAVVKNMTLAIQKGGIKHLEQIYISLGVAHLQLKQYELALSAFESVMEKTRAKTQSIKMARQWITYTQTLKNS